MDRRCPTARDSFLTTSFVSSVGSKSRTHPRQTRTSKPTHSAHLRRGVPLPVKIPTPYTVHLQLGSLDKPQFHETQVADTSLPPPASPARRYPDATACTPPAPHQQ